MNSGTGKLPGRNVAQLTAVSVVAVFLFGTAITYWITSSEDERMRDELLVLTRTASQSIDYRMVNQLSGSPSDPGLAAYQLIKQQLEKSRKNIPRSRFIYLLGRHPDRSVFFLVDSEPPESKDYSPPGQVFYEADRAIHHVFDTMQGAVDGPTTDRWGTWVSGYTPVLNPETGELLAVLGIDVDSRDWWQRVLFYSAAPVSVAVLLAVLLAFSWILYQVAKQEKRFFSASGAALRRYEHIVSSNPYFMSFLDRHYTFQVINDAYVQAFGKPREKIIGHTLAELYSNDFFLTYQKSPVDRALAGQRSGYEAWFDLPMLGRRYLIIDYTPYFEDNVVTGVIASAHDITERKKTEEIEKIHEEKIEHLAYHDSLTNLPNRALFMDRLGQVLAQGARDNVQAAVLFADLDRFKTINDTLGHVVGDELLRHVATRLREVLREGDTVARLGGDEFVILLPRIRNARDAAQVATKSVTIMSVPFSVHGHELHVSTSLGVSIYPRDGEDAETLLKHADTALYQAKSLGRNQYQFFNPSMNAQAHERLLLENNLRRAIERNEFQLNFQPQVNLITNRITGIEALIRWNHPERGIVMPQDFIPIAEETGMINEIAEWVINAACREVSDWQKANRNGSNVRVAVNLSTRQLQLVGLPDLVQSILKKAGLPAEFLELEITESTLMANPDNAVKILSEFNEMGIHITVDDFGTGYSSLAYLKRLPIDRIKIDKSFVRDIPEDPNDVAIVQAILAIAQQLGMHVLAEGVETEEQKQFLMEHGCEEAQGYLFSTPLAPEDCINFLEKGAVGNNQLFN